ncbi:hypothetical protein MPSEU_000958200 [Mayamaea pseudoterrestris]|nr:hypothetical protein MPSEU_000958200 [Mayamaea pseudoterrestris]
MFPRSMPSPLQPSLPSQLLATSSNTTAAPSSPQDSNTLPKSVIFASSGLGGCLGWAIVHPANTLAVRMNLASMHGKPFSFVTMIRESGWMSLYDGLSAGVLRQVFYATTRFGLFETLRDLLHDYRGHTDFASRVLVGATTGGVAAYVSCPMEVCVVRMSNDCSLPLQERRNYRNVLDTATKIVREEGIWTFWRGSNPFVMRAMFVGVFQVATLDQFKDLYASYFQQTKNSMMNVFSAAMTSGFIYSVATMPLEACKNRMASQRKDATGKTPYNSILQTIRKVSVEEGFLALYNGFFPYYIRCGGHTVCMFVIVQLIRDMYSSQYLS